MPHSGSDRDETLLEQRRVIVEFGRTALRSDSLQEILTRACDLCREALGTDLSKVMRLENDGRDLRVIAGVGWEENVVGAEVVPALATSSEGFALKRGFPAVSEDIEKDGFDYPQFLERHGVKAMVNVVIPGSEDRPPFGLLQVDSKHPRSFEQSDIEFLQSYANILGAAIERFEKSEALRIAVTDRERALEELQHRVTNNLAVLQSLLRTRARQVSHPEAQQETALLLGQIETLAHVHRLLSTTSNIDEIEIGGFLSALCSQLGSFGSQGATQCEIQSETEAVVVPSKLAIPLGIIANEFITNSLKHAATDGRCRISLKVTQSESWIEVILKDDGDGLGDALEHRAEAATGSGLNYIETLIRQIGADREWNSDDGTKLHLKLPLAKVPGGALR